MHFFVHCPLPLALLAASRYRGISPGGLSTQSPVKRLSRQPTRQPKGVRGSDEPNETRVTSPAIEAADKVTWLYYLNDGCVMRYVNEANRWSLSVNSDAL